MENFVVSARKYRPATFESVVGQKHITATLRNAIERGQLAHAYLFCGPRGVGKTTCARIFAKAINCLNPNGSEACNQCESCRSFNENRSLNIHELDAASNNSVDDIRALIEQVRIIPQVGRYSLFIIDEVHMLSQAAFNAFLKTLEEPPQHAIFILATTEKHKIIPTILSRCQIYDFNRIRVEDGVEYLRYIAAKEGVAADDESLNLIAQKADGGMRDALSMFDKAVSFCGRELNYREVARTLNVLDYDTYFAVTEQLLGGNYIEALLSFDRVLQRGFAGQTFLSGLNRHLRDLLVAKNPATVKLIEMTGTLMERYAKQAAACDVSFLFGAIDVLTDLDGKIRQSSNQRLLVELGLMKIAGLGQKKNSDTPIAVAAEYPLPELSPAAPAPQPAQPLSRPAPQPAQPAPQPEPRPVVQAEPPKPQPASPAEPQSAPRTETPRPRQARTPLVSLSELMGGGRPAEEPSAHEAQLQEQVDEQCEQKLHQARAALLEAIREMRPRFAAVFSEMRFSENRVAITVPTSELREEILRSRTELLGRLMEVADVKCPLELEITLNEQMRPSLPIRLEDRLGYLSERSADLQALRVALSLEAES
ncbi:MAG: DNA polymerase III subunit gamma/tau [Rikenellaceae bacterium]|nr:DNA polymerase III subunit gamma/tau [Rikenellaceae bacterium]